MIHEYNVWSMDEGLNTSLSMGVVSFSRGTHPGMDNSTDRSRQVNFSQRSPSHQFLAVVGVERTRDFRIADYLK